MVRPQCPDRQVWGTYTALFSNAQNFFKVGVLEATTCGGWDFIWWKILTATTDWWKLGGNVKKDNGMERAELLNTIQRGSG